MALYFFLNRLYLVYTGELWRKQRYIFALSERKRHICESNWLSLLVGRLKVIEIISGNVIGFLAYAIGDYYVVVFIKPMNDFSFLWFGNNPSKGKVRIRKGGKDLRLVQRDRRWFTKIFYDSQWFNEKGTLI
jgi:hypothetical protein